MFVDQIGKGDKKGILEQFGAVLGLEWIAQIESTRMDVFGVQKRLGMCYKSGEIKSRLGR